MAEDAAVAEYVGRGGVKPEIGGHPGARAMAKMIASVRRCDRLAC
jgi:hypothetical protein